MCKVELGIWLLWQQVTRNQRLSRLSIVYNHTANQQRLCRKSEKGYKFIPEAEKKKKKGETYICSSSQVCIS